MTAVKVANIKAFNKALVDAGVPAELVKGQGYFYFAGTDDSYLELDSIYVNSFSQQTPEKWGEELLAVIAKAKA